MAKRQKDDQPAREPLPPHLKPHSTPGMRCPGEWSKVYSEAGNHIGWHCACGRTEGMAPRPRKCPWPRKRAGALRDRAAEREAQAEVHADAARTYEAKEARLRDKRKEDKADAIAVKATRRRGMEARARAKAEALRKEAALLGST